jgi:hypothetical protein
MQAMSKQAEITLRGNGKRGENIVVERAAKNKVQGDRARDWNGRGKGRNWQTCRQHARDCDHEQHHEQH